MWLLTADEMQAVDRETIAAGTPAVDLMRRAGGAVAREVLRMRLDLGSGDVEIVCGKGHNGGDGLVAAGVLAAAGVGVRAHLVEPEAALVPLARAEVAQLRARGVEVHELPGDLEGALAELLAPASLCLDAVLGTGARGAPRGRIAGAITAITRARRPILAVDIASGVEGSTGEVPGVATRADVTVTFGAAKMGHAFHPGRDHTGRLVVAGIGFPAALLERMAAQRTWVDAATAALWLPELPPTAHKYRRGAVVVVAGSRRYTGAAALAADAALRSGAGIVHLVAPDSIRAILQTKLTEVVVHGAAETAAGTLAVDAAEDVLALLPRAHALVVGPGLDAHPDTLACVRAVLASCSVPAVVDADALAGLAMAPQPAPRIVTPHAGELSRWVGSSLPASPVERIAFARAVASARDVVLVAKGAPTIVASQDGNVRIAATGHVGLATAGSGDVLAGILGAVVAQQRCATAAEAAVSAAVAVWLHGRAAELASVGRARRSLVAGDLAGWIGVALAELEAESAKKTD